MSYLSFDSIALLVIVTAGVTELLRRLRPAQRAPKSA